MFNLEAGEAMLTKDNDVDIFIDGNEKFRALMEDLRNAEHFIHIQYYIIKNDVLFNQIKDILIEKAAQGVEVRVLFDAMGCRSVRHSYWKWLNEKGVQTAEFFPAILNALMIAVKSGIEVNIMIPCMPDHPFVYWATYSYIGDMVMAGANCYTYNNGFLHSKGMIVDGKVLCYGTANMDIRSIALNIEVNAVIYDEKRAQEMVDIFQKDLEVCRQITRDYYVARRLKIRIKEQICRLLSPLL